MRLIFSYLFLFSTVSYSSEHCSDGGTKWPKQVAVGAEELVLNGLGSRTHWIWDVYTAALYLPEQKQGFNHILSMPGAKRVAIRFQFDVSAEKLREGWREGFENNHSAEQLEALEQDLSLSYKLLQDMKAGDQILLDYLPQQGTRLTINGAEVATIAGEAYYHGILRMWMGSNPVQDTLRLCLLGQLPFKQPRESQTASLDNS